MKRQFEDKTEITTQEEFNQAIIEIGYYVDEGLDKDSYSEKLCRMVDAYTHKLMGGELIEMSIAPGME